MVDILTFKYWIMEYYIDGAIHVDSRDRIKSGDKCLDMKTKLWGVVDYIYDNGQKMSVRYGIKVEPNIPFNRCIKLVKK